MFSVFVNDRPFSLSSITDCETISRPPSALTSYSNFHGQRRQMQPTANSGPTENRANNFTSLTQESLTNHIRPSLNPNGPTNHFQGTQLTQESLTNHVNTNRLANGTSNNFHQQNGHTNGTLQQAQQQMNVYANNTSYDDLPPPPPPISSSPTDEIVSRAENDSDSAQGSSISMPVPQQRNNARRNEYVNMPVSQQQQQQQMQQQQQQQQMQQQQQQQQQNRVEEWSEPKVKQPGRKSEPQEQLDRNYDARLLPGGGSIESSSPDPSRSAPPLPPMRPHNYANMAGFSYMPEPAAEPVGRHFQIGSRNSRYTDSSADESLSLGHQNGQNVNYNDMMTLRMDARLNYHPEEPQVQQLQQQLLQPNDIYSMKPAPSQIPQLQPLSLQNGQPPKPIIQQNYHRRNGHDNTNGTREPAPPPQQQQQNKHRQISIDYVSMMTNDTPVNGIETNGHHTNGDSQPNEDLQRATRVPTGHQRRDRASLRAKHKQDMEEQKLQKMQGQKVSQTSNRWGNN